MVLFSVLLTRGISTPFFINCQKKSYYEEIEISYFTYESQQLINFVSEMLPYHIFQAEPLLFKMPKIESRYI